MPRPFLFALFTLAALGAVTPRAEARSVDDCEKLKDWHAYNTCLASFGPRRGQRVVTGQPQAEGPEGRVYGGRRDGTAAARRAPGGLVVQRTANGRVRASFDLTAPIPKRR
jgi:hypothetical protein